MRIMVHQRKLDLVSEKNYSWGWFEHQINYRFAKWYVFDFLKNNFSKSAVLAIHFLIIMKIITPEIVFEIIEAWFPTNATKY